MSTYSGDENLSDAQQNPELEDDDDQYDHDFEPERVCTNCDEAEENCNCDLADQDFDDTDECAVCGMSEADPVHGGE